MFTASLFIAFGLNKHLAYSKAKCPSPNKWIFKNVVQLYNGIKLSDKKEWNIYAGLNMYEPLKHANLKKPVTKDHILYDSIYTVSRIGKSIETESNLMVG